jgi:nucleoside-diphosphate-sugar epimerase
VRALVTGANGFVGAHLTARLVADGWDVVAVVRRGSPDPAWRLAVLGCAADVELVPADLSDPSETRAAGAAADADVVFLLAAARAGATPAARAATLAVNSASGTWLVDAVSDRCRAVVRLGSSTEYGQVDAPMDENAPLRPRGFFGATKAAGSLLVTAAAAARGLRACVLRAFQVYGPLDHPGRLVPTVLRAAITGTPLALTEPGRRRDWVYVDDVVEACARAALADNLPPGQVLNVGTGVQVANEELVTLAQRVTGRTIELDVGAHPGRPWDTGSWVCDPSLARDLLGWEAKVSLEEGLRRCWEAEARR